MAQPGQPSADTLDLPDDVGELFTRLYEDGMTDGLPVIPPTAERVAAMVAGCRLAASHVIGEMPPRGGNPDLTDTEIARAIVYMANQSGANFQEPAAKAPATK